MSGFDIAVVSTAGRYSNASSSDELWEALVEGRELNTDADQPVPQGHIPRVPQVAGAAEFDHEFFGMSPAEAALIDPQQRLILTCAFRALEDAGYGDGAPRRWGVFASTSFSTYLLNNVMTARPDLVQGANMLAMIGNIPDSAATRLAYRLNLQGPAMTVQTACSSSLVALGIACRSLLDYECDGAVVAACSLTIPQRGTRRHTKESIFSADGYCRPFDASGAGTIKGNGCSAVVLRRLEDAIDDHDPVLAVIDAVAVNNDGDDKVGYTAPSVTGEEEVIREALSLADLAPSDIDYLEAHGTGTALGDPIEIRALARVFDSQTVGLPVGSIKANVGHLDCAAGLTSLVKVTSMLRTGILPPLINFTALNPEIDNSKGTFRFPTVIEEGHQLRHVGISSFGIGGTNAHAVVSAHAIRTHVGRTSVTQLPALVHVSAVRPQDVERRLDDLRRAVESGADSWDVAYSALRNDRRMSCDAVASLGGTIPDDVTLQGLLSHASVGTPGLLPVLDACRRAVAERHLLPDHEETEAAVLVLAAMVCPQDPAVAQLGLEEEASRVARSLAPVETQLWNRPVDDDAVGALRALLGFLLGAGGSKNLMPLFAGTGTIRVPIPHCPLAPIKHWVGPEDALRSVWEPSNGSDAHSRVHVGRSFTALDRVVSAVSEVLNVPAAPDSDFFTLGGDSLQAIEVLDLLRDEYPDLNLAAFLGASSLRDIAATIEVESASGGFHPTLPENFTVLRDDAGDEATPTFLIHPAGGTVFQYRVMSRMMATPTRLVGVSLPDDYRDYQDLHSLADLYARQIDSFWPCGEVRLGGYSAGGNITVEVATILSGQGRAVAPPCLIDPLPPLSYAHTDPRSSVPAGMQGFLLDAIGIEAEQLRDSAAHDERGVQKLLISRGLTRTESQDIVDKWLMSHRILAYDPPKRFPGDVTVVCAREQMPPDVLAEMGIVEHPRRLWSDYIDGSCHLTTVGGNHMSMMTGTNLVAVANRVDEWLSRLSTGAPR